MPATRYHWRARATASVGSSGAVAGAWSDPTSFRTSAIRVTVPRLVSPSNGATDVPIRTCPAGMFTVRDASLQGRTGRLGIQLQVATDPEFDNVVARFETHQRDRGQTNLCIRVALSPATEYFWRVRARVADSPEIASDWSAPWRFTTAERRGPTTAPGRGQCCPPPNRFSVVLAIVEATGDLYRRDIQQFTQRVAECLAAEDGDWGRRLNDSGAVGKDTVAYRTNKGPGHGPFSIDIMLGAESSDPRPHWNITTHNGVVGRVGGKWLAVNGANCIL